MQNLNQNLINIFQLKNYLFYSKKNFKLTTSPSQQEKIYPMSLN